MSNTPPPEVPLISVLIPSYNHSKYLPACLTSIYEDDYPCIEVVIVDDGSQDDSTQVAALWRQHHIGRFVSFRLERQGHSGITKTLNRLVALSTGEFLTFVGSDDCVLKGGVNVRVKALMQRPEWLAVFGDSTEIDEVGRETKQSVLIERYGADLVALESTRFRKPELILNWSVPGPVFLARKSAYSDAAGVGLYDENMVVEDRDLYLRLLSRDAIGFVNAKVAAYRVHGRNFNSQPDTAASVLSAVAESERRNIRRFGGGSAWLLKIVWLRSHSYRKFYECEGRSKVVWFRAFQLLEKLRTVILRVIRLFSRLEAAVVRRTRTVRAPRPFR